MKTTPKSLKKADLTRLKAPRRGRPTRCAHCGSISALLVEKWWLRQKTVRGRRRVCRACRRAFVTFEVAEPLYREFVEAHRHHQNQKPRSERPRALSKTESTAISRSIRKAVRKRLSRRLQK